MLKVLSFICMVAFLLTGALILEPLVVLVMSYTDKEWPKKYIDQLLELMGDVTYEMLMQLRMPLIIEMIIIECACTYGYFHFYDLFHNIL